MSKDAYETSKHPWFALVQDADKASMDFETYSEAGYVLRHGAWKSIMSRGKKSGGKGGLSAVGTARYSEDKSTEILTLCYKLPGGTTKVWLPGMAPPEDLFAFIKNEGRIKAFNSFFEYKIWKNVAKKRLGWIELPLHQLECTSARSLAYSLPGGLEAAAERLGVQNKDPRGKKLINLYSRPNKITKKRPTGRNYLRDTPKDNLAMSAYCARDVAVEDEVATKLPQLSQFERLVWMVDQRINDRGVAIDIPALEACVKIVDEATELYTRELQRITGRALESADQTVEICRWANANGVSIPDVKADTIKPLLNDTSLPEVVRRVLNIRAQVASASVKKLFAIQRMVSSDGRMRGLFKYCGAHTGRWSSNGPQGQNLKSGGPTKDWNHEKAKIALAEIARGDVGFLEQKYGSAIFTVAGCLRALFQAGPGKELVCSDFSAIEAVVLAVIANEPWRIEVFRTHGKIYEASASKMSGIPLQEILDYPKSHHGEKHPLRKRGKVRELAFGYRGWVNAALNFGAGDFMTEEEIKNDCLSWRKESPNIVELWGGQVREIGRYKFRHELFGLEGAAIAAIQNRGKFFSYGYLSFYVDELGIMHMVLPSGRHLHYHNVRLERGVDRYSKQPIYKIVYDGWNTDSSKGPVGWLTMYTHGGKLTENGVQAIARDVQAHSVVTVEINGYPVVLHVHDEVGSERNAGTACINEFERMLMALPWWAKGWPLRVAGGWIGKKFRKG